MKDNKQKQPPKTPDESLKVPQPPQQVKQDEPAAQKENKQSVEPTQSEETVINNNADQSKTPAMPDKVQHHDWNNGKPEVTKEHEPKLDSHKEETAEQKNDKELRENKGNKEGDPVLEASEEVNTGQNAG